MAKYRNKGQGELQAQEGYYTRLMTLPVGRKPQDEEWA